MAQASSIKFGQAALLLGNGAGPEVFTAPCGVEELTLNINIESNNVNIPDCDDPDLAGWLATDIVSHQMRIDFGGLLDRSAMEVWQAWWLTDSGEEKNVRWLRDLITADGGGHFQAPGVLVAYNETATARGRFRVSGSIALNGKPVFTPAA